MKSCSRKARNHAACEESSSHRRLLISTHYFQFNFKFDNVFLSANMLRTALLQFFYWFFKQIAIIN